MLTQAGVAIAMGTIEGELVDEVLSGGPALQSWKPLWDAAVLDSFDETELIDVENDAQDYFHNTFTAVALPKCLACGD